VLWCGVKLGRTVSGIKLGRGFGGQSPMTTSTLGGLRQDSQKYSQPASISFAGNLEAEA